MKQNLLEKGFIQKMKINKMKNKIIKNQKRKSWWKEHWDEVVLIIGVLLGLYLTLKGLGVIK
ncbi:MAG: hypothetical protein WC755_09825 [Candidatus Woesearchaeota archaeon]|jgi:hypothetical protein